mgnify:CR=1 FL=1
MKWTPELFGPRRENHIVRSSSVVNHVVYEKNRIAYSTFDAPENSVDVLRLAFEPQSVSADGKALAAALAMHKELNPDGRPLVNSVNGEEASMQRVLPLVAEYGTAVIGLAMDDDGIPPTAEGRLAVATKIVERAGQLGIPPDRILIDCLALTVGADSKAGWTTLEAIRLVKEELGVNLALGASNVSFGLPEREIINGAFLAMAIARGLNCPIVDAAKVRHYILAADLALGRDDYSMRYLKGYRQRQKLAAAGGQ